MASKLRVRTCGGQRQAEGRTEELGKGMQGLVRSLNQGGCGGLALARAEDGTKRPWGGRSQGDTAQPRGYEKAHHQI